jgi:hypothetical protein
MPTPQEVEAFILTHIPTDEIYENCGPNDLMGKEVWEVWTKENGRRMSTRFVEVQDDKPVKVLHVFEKLVERLNTRYAAEARDLKAMQVKADIANKRVAVIALTASAAGGFIVSLLAFLFLATKGGDAFWPSIIMLASTLVSSGTALMGSFKLVSAKELSGIGLPDSQPRDAQI